MRFWIATFMLCLFALQALPVPVPGKAFFKTQASMTDEDRDDDEGDAATHADAKLKKQWPQMDDFLHHAGEAAHFRTTHTWQTLRLHDAMHLPELFAGEVATPPPDLR
jgi:hypothetical protein